MRERVWNFFSDVLYLFDFKVDLLFPEKKTKRWFLRVVALLCSPVIIVLFLAFNIFDSVVDLLN